MERLAPRLLSASIVFVLAYRSDPFVVGIYSATMLAYTFLQASVESAVRQILPSVAHNRRFLRKYLLFSCTISPIFLLVIAGAIAVTSWARVGAAVLWLSSVAVVPVFNALALPYIGQLQLSGKWGSLARAQVLGVTAATALSLSVIFTISPIAGVALFLPSAEACNALLVKLDARGISRVCDAVQDPPMREMLGMAGFSATGWLQGQADRVLLSLFAGAGALGSLSVASAMARAIGDPLSGASSNLLRVRLATVKGDADVRSAFNHVLFRSLGLSTVAALAVIAGAEIVARPILGARWASTISLVPVLSVGIFFSLMNANFGALQVFHKNIRNAISIPLVALLAAPVVAVTAYHDLYAASWLIVGRDAGVSLAAFFSLRKRVPRAPLIYAISAATGISVLAILISVLQL